MDRKVKSFRLRVDLLDWLKAYAGERGSSEIAVMESALVDFRSASEGGVPDLPEETAQDLSTPVGDGLAVRPLGHVTPAERADWAKLRQAKLNEGKYR